MPPAKPKPLKLVRQSKDEIRKQANMPPKSKSGHQKRVKGKIELEKIESQRGALLKFFKKQDQSSSVDKDEDNIDDDMDEDDVNDNVDEEDANDNEENGNVNRDEEDANDSLDEEDVNANVDEEDAHVTPNIDIFDPRCWDGLGQNMINMLVKNGPKRDLTIVNGPVDKRGRRFSNNIYTRILPNRETSDRVWLVYSKEVNTLFCFCCKLFKHGHRKSGFNNEGYVDWKHVDERVKEHEVSVDHMKNMNQWFEMRKRLECNKTIDKVVFEHFKKERDYWKEVIFRLISLVKFLAKHGLAFRGNNEKLIKHFKNYREVGLSKAIDEAKEIAIEMGVDPVFPQRRQIRRKKHFDETSSAQDVEFTPEGDFRVNYFFKIVDQAISSLETRFEQYKQYEKLFGFLFPKKLRVLDEKTLKSCCFVLQDALMYEEKSDIDANELYEELKLFETFLPTNVMSPLEALNNLKQLGFFPNALIAYRVLLTLPVTVASAERGFSKLKLLKSYLRSTMSQERLNGLAMIAIENDILEGMNYQDLIENFASKNAKRAARFG